MIIELWHCKYRTLPIIRKLQFNNLLKHIHFSTNQKQQFKYTLYSSTYFGSFRKGHYYSFNTVLHKMIVNNCMHKHRSI